jgi:signal transduction histidine kinase
MTHSKPRSEREQTDESLRLEREHSDNALEQLAAIDATADDVISRARERADRLVASARAKTDQAASALPSDALKKSRASEDSILENERLTADQILEGERAGHAALLSRERSETDKDLSHERARSDSELGKRDDFMGIVSHDLLNMLNAVVGVSVLIETEVSRDNHVERVLTHARRIQRAGSRMRRLVGDLVDVASIEAGMLTVTPVDSDPAEVVTEAVEIFQAQGVASGLAVRAEIIQPLPRASFDPARILQVIGNLLSNAVKFAPSPGSVNVRVERVGDNIVFAVTDNGEGIPADKLNAVFERFVQLTSDHRRGGVGLGLYISKCIIEGHGGQIWAESRSGSGSTFSFAVPIDGPKSPTRS